MKFTEFLRKAHSEDNGNPSSMRLYMGFTLLLLVPVVTWGFIYVVRNSKELIIAYLVTIVGLIGGLLGIKAYQKGKEEGSNEKPAQEPPAGGPAQ